MDMTNVRIYQPDDLVLVDYRPGQPWAIGVVTAPTDPQYGWTKVAVKLETSLVTTVPGWMPDKLKPATEADLAAAPQWSRDFVARDRLNRRDPPILKRDIPTSAYASLKTYGVNRFSHLKAMSDADLLKLKGVGSKALQALRKWQQDTEDQLVRLKAPAVV